MEMRKCNNCGAKVSFRVCTQCLRETVKGLEAELKQSNEQFEVMPAGKDRNMVDERIELITAHIKFRQELDDKISKSAMEAELEMAEIQKLKNIRNIAKEDADLTKRFPDIRSAKITAKLKDGRVISHKSDSPFGMPENPVQWSDIVEKFHACTDKVLSDKSRNTVLEMVQNLEQVSSMEQVFQAFKQ